ncbi:MAG: PLDc N-terminal domain-containing protein [Cyclobacteriaceae bacterium]
MYTILSIVWIIAIVYVVYEVWAVNKNLTNGMKVVWSIAALVFGILTAIIYYFTQKK